MNMKKMLSLFLVLGFLTCNLSVASPNYYYSTQGPVQQTVTYQRTNYYPNDNYYYGTSSPQSTVVTSSPQRTVITTAPRTTVVTTTYQPEVVYQETVVQKETFADKHPVMTGLGVGLLFAGAIAGAVLLSDDEPRHHDRRPHHHDSNHRRG